MGVGVAKSSTSQNTMHLVTNIDFFQPMHILSNYSCYGFSWKLSFMIMN